MLREGDIFYLTDFYLGLYKNENDFIYWIDIEILVNKMLVALALEFEYDFTKDNILKNELIYHMKPALYRIRNGLKLSEDTNIELRRTYPIEFEKTKKVLKKIINYCDDEELAYICIMLIRALKRNKINKRKKILVVCGLGYSSSKMIADNLQEEFNVQIVDILPYNQLESYRDLDKIDLIVTNLDFKLKPYDVIKINTIFTDEDIQKLKDRGLNRSKKILESELLDFVINNKDKTREEIIKNIRENFSNVEHNLLSNNEKRFYEFLEEDLVGLKLNLNSIDEVLKEISNRLYKKSYVIEDYDKILKENIKKYGEYILLGSKSIIPHAELNRGVFKTGFCLITLAEDIDFYGVKIKNVIALVSKDKDEHIKAISDLNYCIQNKDFENKLANTNNFYEVVELFKGELNDR